MMNTHIARKQLNSRTFDAEDLQQATNLLATWLIQASHGKTARLSLQVTATIWGFARSEGETECADLRERIEVSSEGASVKLASHNVIEVTFLPLPVVPETPIPSIRRVFESVMPFEHLQKSRVITFRVHLKGESGEKRDTTVVFYGVKRGTTFTLEGIWPVAPGQMPEELFQATRWPQESNFLTLLHDFKNGKFSMPGWVATELFNPGDPKKFNLLNWFFSSPDNKPKHFLIRLGVASLALAVGIFALTARSTFTPLFVIPTLFAAIALLLLLGIRIVTFFMTYKLFKEGSKKLYDNPVRHPKVDMREYPQFLGDPAVEKYSQEVTNAGGHYLATVGMESGVTMDSLARIYHFEEGQTTLTLAFLEGNDKVRNSPVTVNFLLNTYFEDGWRLVTSTASSLFRRDLGSLVRSQTLAGVSDVEELLLRHEEGVKKMIAEGHSPRTLTREESLERLVLDHEDSREKIKKLGYFTYLDAFLWTFDLNLKKEK